MNNSQPLSDAFYLAFSHTRDWVSNFRASPSQVAHATAHQVTEIMSYIGTAVDRAGEEKAVDTFLAEETKYLSSDNIRSHQKLLLAASLQRVRREMAKKGYTLPESDTYQSLHLNEDDKAFQEMKSILDKRLENEQALRERFSQRDSSQGPKI